MIKFYLSLSRYLTVFLVCLAFTGFAQQKTVSGKVTSSDDGSSIPGVNVLEKGTSNGTVSDSNGEFKMSVGDNATLTFSFVGYKTQEVVVGAQTTINIILESDITSLSEVVVVGYGEQEKKDVTGVITAVGEKNFNKGVIVSPEQLLNGKVAGVQITPADGQPGSGGNVRIRGGTSLSASNEPLYVIDGFPVVNDGTNAGRNPLNFINANDIETFTVLKDASAAAIYGSRAANGVVIITTKKGKKGAPAITYDGYYSTATVAKKYDVLNADQFRSAVTYWAPQNLQYLGDNSNSDVANKAYNTNWQNQIFRQAPALNHNLTVSGGSDKTSYRFSVGHLEQQGVINTSYTKKTSVGMSLSQLLFNDDLKIDVNMKGAQMEDRFSPSVIGDALQFDPTHPVYDQQSQFAGYYEYFKYNNGNRVPVMLAPTNPVSNLNQTNDIGKSFRALGNIQLDYKIKYVPGLRAVLNLGYDITAGQRHTFQPSTLKYEATPDTGKVVVQNPYKYSRLLEGYLNYKTQLSEYHKIDATVGYSWQDFYASYDGFTSTRLSSNLYGYYNPQAGKQTIPFNPNIGQSKLISFYGRINYSFKDKYMITVNVRRDGSSRFGPLNRWGTYPSVAAGWRMLNESFMQGLQSVFTDLKLRAGYGVVGNQAGIGDYGYLPTYTSSDAQSSYQLGSTYYNTIRPSGYDNHLKWEQTATANIGLDFGILNGRLSGALEVYQKNTTNLLFNRSVAPGANLTNQITTNIGEMQNQGIELTLNGVAIDKEDLKWNVSLNAAYNKNVIKVLDGNNDPTYAGYPTGGISGGVGNNIEILRVGQPVNSYYVYQHKTGADGKPVGDNFGNAPLTDLYVDQNKDGIINEKDLRPYKKPLPDVIMGMTSNLTYKNWDLTFTLRANLGNYNYNNVASGASYKNLGDNFWPRNMVTQVLNTTYYNPQYFSDYFVQKASFLRMDNITIGYNLSKVSNTNLKVRLYGTIQNAFVITKYAGVDPEIAANTGGQSGANAGIDNSLYPRARTFTVGIRVGF